MKLKTTVNIFWFRRDLRFNDNVGLYNALKNKLPLLPIFIYDSEILNKLPKNDARVSFIYETLQKLNSVLVNEFSSSIGFYHGKTNQIFESLISEYQINTVYTNHDYEPYAEQRDLEIKKLLDKNSISFKTFKDQVIFEKNEVVKPDGNPYVVYTPYKNKWKSLFCATKSVEIHDSLKLLNNTIKTKKLPHVSIQDLGFIKSNIVVSDYYLTPDFIDTYEGTRDYPATKNGTSNLGPHLRFGTVSIRQIIKEAILHENETFWNELIWREFFMQILWHYPHTVTRSFRPKYDRIQWRNNPNEFEKWKNGLTGYPLVDAGMRQLNATGFMHNRVRMLVASFLCKHLLIDWRWGEAYFAEKLLDYDLSANIGNWQWAAGSGVDAAPYFRIFNPQTQVIKFDKQKEYINQWVPDLQEFSYPEKIVDHKFARERCLKVYKEAVNN